jgi:hypothetical protein
MHMPKFGHGPGISQRYTYQHFTLPARGGRVMTWHMRDSCILDVIRCFLCEEMKVSVKNGTVAEGDLQTNVVQKPDCAETHELTDMTGYAPHDHECCGCLHPVVGSHGVSRRASR